MNKYGLLILAILVSGAVYAGIYKWTDENGIVHFSDTPHPGAVPVDLPTQDIPAGQSPDGGNVSSGVNKEPPNSDAEQEKNARGYTLLGISEPKNEATIRNNQGYIPVIIEINPELKQGDLLQIIFDAEPLGKPQASMIFALNNVKRGSHTIAVEALDADGNVLNTSDEITIYMQRPRVGMVANTGSIGKTNP